MAFKTINLYFCQCLALLGFYVLVALVGLDFLIDFASRSGSDTGEKQLATALLEQFQEIPEKVTVYFPFAVLVGSVLALGNLTTQLELEAAFSLGYSYLRLFILLMLFSLFSAVVMFAFNELTINFTKNSEHSENNDSSPDGYWFRERSSIIHAEQVVRDARESRYQDVQFFAIRPDGKLEYIVVAEHMLADEQTYHFDRAQITHLGTEKLESYRATEFVLPRLANPADEESVAVPEPGQLHITALLPYIHHLEMSKMYSELYKLEFWERFAEPLSIPIMLLMALPFLLLNLQKGYSRGIQLLLAIIFGASYWIVSQAFANVSIIWELPAVLGAFGMHLFCLVAFALYFSVQRFSPGRKPGCSGIT